MRVLRAVIETNEEQPEKLVHMVESAIDNLQDRHVTVLGLAFKPDTDDVRETPTVPIVQRLVARGARVTVHDPVVRSLPDQLGGLDVALSSDLEGALRNAQAVVLVTRWNQYSEVPALLAAVNPSVPFIDGRRMLERTSISNYAGIGAG
jgi:UDPglucose 6-dehydrogenase/GDP-mannose 6-dehydrogenase